MPLCLNSFAIDRASSVWSLSFFLYVTQMCVSSIAWSAFVCMHRLAKQGSCLTGAGAGRVEKRCSTDNLSQGVICAALWRRAHSSIVTTSGRLACTVFAQM